jgi:hypothetical protein
LRDLADVQMLLTSWRPVERRGACYLHYTRWNEISHAYVRYWNCDLRGPAVRPGEGIMFFQRGFGGYALGALAALAMLLAASTSRADTAVSACGTLSAAGNYFLTKNLTSAGTCIVIGDQGVAFDMRGHTITGDGSGDGITDGGSHFESMAIANGKIRNFSVGIGLDNSCCVVIRNIDSSKNTLTGIIVGKCCGTIDSVTANNNGNSGIVASDCCFTINNVQANGNGGGGGIVAAASGCCTTVANSIVSGNGGAGVFLEGCCSFLVSSTVKGSGADGVDMNSCCNFVISSTVAGNAGKGVSLIGDDNLVVGSTVFANGGDGIFLASDTNQITNTSSTGNGGFGANVECPGAITGLSTKNNTGGKLNTTGGTCTQLNNKLL